MKRALIALFLLGGAVLLATAGSTFMREVPGPGVGSGAASGSASGPASVGSGPSGGPGTGMPASGPEAIRIRVDPWVADYRILREGVALINASAPDYAKALAGFEKNIERFPHAPDIDYSFGWGMICAAHLGRYEQALAYYQVMRERFGGEVEGGASGAVRIWDNRLAQVKQILAAASDTRALAALAAMAEFDRTHPPAKR